MKGLLERPGTSASFQLRRLEKPEEFREAEELATLAGVPLGESPVPASLQRTIQDNGGLVLGAFADIHLAGVTVSYLGWDGTTLYLYSALTAVRPEYQNHHLGRQLKLREREEALSLGLGEIRWTADPLASQSALLGIRRLGAIPDRYLVHYFGRGHETSESPIPSDRLRTVWRLTDARVKERIEGGSSAADSDTSLWKASTPVLETDVGEAGLRIPAAVAEPTASRVTIEIPFDLRVIQQHQPGSVRPWRHAVRDAFRACLDIGYAVDDFVVVSAEHERRSFYLLSARAPSAGTPTPARPEGPHPSATGRS